MPKQAVTSTKTTANAAADAAVATTAERPAATPEAQLRRKGAEIAKKLAEMARAGDVRAASLVFKLLEKEGLEDDETKSQTVAGFRRRFAKIEKTVVAEIVSLLAKADRRTEALGGGVEPPKR